eukprot:COSAG04_NODE_1177_length_7916_cov_13.807599_6_plen_730_part_00
MSATTDNPLAADGPPADIELQEAGPFPLTLKDMFTNAYVVEARPQMPVHEVKELVRTAKKEEAEGRLAATRGGLARLEAEAARARAKPELAALEARKAESAGEIARLEDQVREVESVEFLDAAVLLFDGQPLDDERTVDSHGLSRTTTVTLSMTQDPELGRARREERVERALREALVAERRAKLKKMAGAGSILLLLNGLAFGAAGVAIEALACALGCAAGYALWRLPDESVVVRKLRMQGWSQKRRATAGALAPVLLAELVLLIVYFTTCDSEVIGALFCGVLAEPVVPAQCVAGMGSHGVVYKGTAYRTLDDAPPEGEYRGDPNGGCQRICTEYYDHDGTSFCLTWGEPNYLPLPPGYALAPPDAHTIAVIAAHGWSTLCAVTADGEAWYSANWGDMANYDGDDYTLAGSSCGSDSLASSGGSHTVTWCESRVLARCPEKTPPLTGLAFGAAGAGIEALGCALGCAAGYALWRLPDESEVIRKLRMQGWSQKRRAAAGALAPALLVQLVLLIVYATVGCGGLDCGANGQCVGLVTAACACEGNFIGPFCETECPIPDCGAHGNFATRSILAAREANSCSALFCACEGNWAGQFCEFQPLNNETVPAQCVAGMGSHGVVYNGTAYRTLDDAPPEGPYDHGDPNSSCQGTSNYLPLPPGYALAPPDADTIAVIAAHGWSTYGIVTADGGSWYSGSGRSFSGGASSYWLASSGGSHTVTTCNFRVLARCP